MQSITLQSPAKLNLILRVVGKRRDGYHELRTLFHRISLSDTLHLIKRREGVRLICSDPKVPKKKNLIIEAFHLLQRRRLFEGGVRVSLTKRIPVAGGLGGGSSNVAAFLQGMNQLYRLRLSGAELIQIGNRLGSDIAFFLSGARHAMGRGRGEKIEPLRFSRRLWFLLLVSGRGLSTTKVYGNFDSHALSLTQITHDVTMASAFLEKGDLVQAKRLLVNDLTRSAEGLSPALKKARERLDALQLGIWQMSGSGPTLFGIFLSRPEAEQTRRVLWSHFPRNSLLLCRSE